MSPMGGRRARRALLITLILAVLGGAAAGLYRAATPPAGGDRHARTSVLGLLGGDAGDDPDGYARATTPRPFSFPADHGPHPRFKQEWWYFTGNLRDDHGRRFGYELTFFRIALRPSPVERPSRWGMNQLYMAHFAVTDPRGKAFHAFERLERGALGLAGARARPFHVWLDDWSATAADPGATFPVALHADGGGVSVDFTLARGKPVVPEGDRGLSRKGPGPGNASYYYSLTRMPTRGKITVGGRIFQVRGASWMDREWSTSALAGNQAGWDWFALQLSDGRELMFYRLRDKDGSVDPYSSGTLVGRDGKTRYLSHRDVELTPEGRWRSPRSGIRYPARWRVRVPGQGLSLTVTPLLADQELDGSVTYWEGAVRVKGRSQGRDIGGQGYVEMTGYSATQ